MDTVAVSSGGGGSPLAVLLFVVLAFVIQGCIWGVITRYICQMKGHQKGFAWGFWLGLIGLLVVGFLPNLNKKAREVLVKSDDADTLEKLAKLHQQGILTDEEFNQKKADILAKM